jgi:uncharacterized membrane protein (DUF4010 family)
MRKRSVTSTWRDISTLIVILAVFGLTALMVVQRYEPAVITTVVTATCLAAAELVRRLREPSRRSTESDRDRGPAG